MKRENQKWQCVTLNTLINGFIIMLIYKHFFSHFFIFGFVGFSPSYLSSHSPETKPVTSSCDWLRRLSVSHQCVSSHKERCERRFWPGGVVERSGEQVVSSSWRAVIQRVEPGRRLLQHVTSCRSSQRATQSLVKRRLTVCSTLQRLKVLRGQPETFWTEIHRPCLTYFQHDVQ